MTRFRSLILLLVATLALAASACGGSSGGSTSVPADVVALVGDQQVTVDQLDQQIQLRLNAAKADGQTMPKVGTAEYRTQVVQPVVDTLVFNLQVEAIAKKLGVTVTDDELHKALDDAIQQTFKGDQSKYQAYLKKYNLTEDEVISLLIRPHLLQQKIETKLTGQFKVTDQQISDYYNQHKTDFVTPDSRDVQFVLTGNKQDAQAVRDELTSGADWDKVAKKYAIAPGPPSTGGDFTATKGSVEQNFGNAVFGELGTGDVSDLIPVSKAYMQSSLAGKCKPQCYFVVQPKDGIKKGHTQTLDEAKAQISSQLTQATQQKAIAKFTSLLNAQKKLTHYNTKYAPPKTQSTSTGATSGQ
jgi:hypothetical protein